jgi:hypothetical protein
MSTTKFILRCEIPTGWVPHFLGMLKRLQWLGAVGSSRYVTIYADGDGSFRPRFDWDDDLPEPAKAKKISRHGHALFDTG